MPKLDSRGRVTLPPSVRECLELRAGGQVVFAQTAGGWVIHRADQRSAGETAESAYLPADGCPQSRGPKSANGKKGDK